MSEYITVDDQGNEHRETKSRGRSRLGFKVCADGNWRLDPTFSMDEHLKSRKSVTKVDHFYITNDVNGNEISRTLVGRGRPVKGFTKDASGNFVRTETPVVTPAPVIENTITAPATPATV